MNLVAWIAAHITPALPHRLLALMVFHFALLVRSAIGDAMAEWRRCASHPRLPDVIDDDLRFLTGIMEWLERMARYALWMRAHQLCGRRAPHRLNPHVGYATTPVTPECLYQRLRNLLAQLVRMEDEAAELAAQWKREKYCAGASPLPPSLRYGAASRPSSTSADEMAPALILRSLAQQGVSKDEGLSRSPALATGPPASRAPRKPKPHTSLLTSERTPPHAHHAPLAPLRAA
jgi:hypothetical protein